MGDITRLLDSARAGDRQSRDQLFNRVYEELHRLAVGKLSRLGPSGSLDASELVSEAFLRLQQQPDLPGVDRRSFFAYAAGIMRSVIVDQARARGARKRGGDWSQVTLQTEVAEDAITADPVLDLEALDAALVALARVDERGRQIVELRYFAGLSMEESAEIMGVSLRTAKRDWQRARAFLYGHLEGDGGR